MSVLSAQATISAPNGYAVTVGTVNQLGVPANSSRGGLIFYNNSATAIISLCPSSLAVIPSGAPPANPGQTFGFTGVGSPSLGVPVQNGPGSITLAPGGASFIMDNLNCGGAWNAISSVAGGALTVLEF